jgi:hypothetical protein
MQRMEHTATSSSERARQPSHTHNTMPTRPHGSRYGCSQSTSTRAPCTSKLIVLGCNSLQRTRLTATSGSKRPTYIGTTNTCDAPPRHTPRLQPSDDYTRTMYVDAGCARTRQHAARTAHCEKQQRATHMR